MISNTSAVLCRIVAVLILLALLALVFLPEWPTLPPAHHLIRQTEHVPRIQLDIERLYMP